ncbi:hypothetical protein FBU30_004662 [Linnemannia zychae]|nr:hypothetical protein FBU30_004662 [Linnemannia zychae]
MKEQQKREFERNENRTLEDPHGMDGINVITPLSPPPRPNSSIMNKPQLLPDSPYLPKLEIQVKDEKHQMGQDPSEDTEIIPLSLSCPVDSSSLPTLPAPPSPPVAPRAPRQQKTSSQEAIPALQVSSTQPPPDVIGEGGTSPASARYIAYPPSPSCYVFDSSQQKYLPSFVNMAARIDQQSKLVHTSSSCSTGSIGNGTTLASSHHLGLSPLSSSAPTFPPSAATATPRQKVVITGLGRETVGRSCEEIEDKRRLAAASSTTAIVDSTNSLNTLSPSADTVVPDSSSHLLHPQRAVISAGGQGESLMTRSGVGSPTGSTDSHQSYHSRHYSQNQQSSPHRLQRTHSQPYLHSPLIAENSDLGDSEDNEENKDTAQLPSTSQSSEIQPSQPPRPQPVRPLVTKKASLLKRRTSKLTIITPQSPVFRSNSSPRLVSGSSGEEAESPYSRTSSPHPYVGDF